MFAERAFRSPLASFLVGFSMLAAGCVSAAGLPIAYAGEYLQTVVAVPPILAAIIFLVVVGALNARGIRESKSANLAMTAIELSGLIIVLAVVSLFGAGGEGDFSRAVDVAEHTGIGQALLGGGIIAYYSFVGFETSAFVIEKVKIPPKVYPKALFAALITTGAVYVLVGVASSAALPAEELQESTGPPLAVVEAAGIGVPSWLFSIISLIAVANGVLLTMIMASRLAYGMAEQGLLPRVLGRVLPRRRTPWVGSHPPLWLPYC